MASAILVLTFCLCHCQMMERAAETDNASFGPRFVAAFAQSNEGDTSPNIQGAYCGQSGAQRLPVHYE